MATIAHFDVPADDPSRAKKFYELLFGWKFNQMQGPMEYYLIETTDLSGKPSVGGGLGKRGAPDQRITNYIGVQSVDEHIAKAKMLGAKIIMEKTAVPGWGYLAILKDTENNNFGLWQEDNGAK